MHLCCDFRGTVTLSHVWNFFSFRWMKLSLRNVGVSCMSRHVHVNIKKICKSGRKNRKGVNKFYIKPFVLTPAVSFPVELSPCACSADREASVFRHTHTHTYTHARSDIMYPCMTRSLKADHVWSRVLLDSWSKHVDWGITKISEENRGTCPCSIVWYSCGWETDVAQCVWMHQKKKEKRNVVCIQNFST